MPTPRVYIDFESRSKLDIWRVGAWVYAQDPSTEILCLCYAVDDGPVIRLAKGQQLKDGISKLNEMVHEGYEFHAHNAYFERCMWLHQLIRFYGASPMPIKAWRCTAAKCSAHALPRSLEHAAKALGLTQQKDIEGNRLMLRLARSTGPIAQEDMDRLILYCERDVLTEREMDKKLPDLSFDEQRTWFLDQYINDTGVCVDLDAVQKANALIAKEKEALNNELSLLTGGAISTGTQTGAIKSWLEEKGLELPNLQKNTVKEALQKADPKFLRILQLRQQLSLTSLAKYESLLAATSADGRVRDLLVYHGASTGRWSGKLVQIQNLAKPEDADFNSLGPISLLKKDPEAFAFLYEGEILPVLSSCIRGMFIPSPGNEMFITDFAAIEARVVMWLAGEEVGLQEFRDQDSNPQLPGIYVNMARRIKKNPSLTKKDKKDRQLGKQTVLGCGFGMGEIKFQETCDKYSVDLGPRTLNVERGGEIIPISPLARDSVQAYRAAYPRVVQFWYAMEEAAKQTVLSGNPHNCGQHIRWYMDGEFLRMELPSKRTLAYHRPKVDASGKLSVMAADPVTKHYRPEYVWGGVLVENATQAVARDIMRDAMLNSANDGYRILFTVHDELVLEAPKGTKDTSDVLRIVKTIPAWASGCPINAECEQVERYKK